MTLKEIETKQLSLLEIKRIKKGLSEPEKNLHQKLSNKYRTKTGRLKKGGYYVNSNGQWSQS